MSPELLPAIAESSSEFTSLISESQNDSEPLETPSTAAPLARQISGQKRVQKRTRNSRARNLWSHSRLPKPGEPIKTKHGRYYFNCRHCNDPPYQSTNNTSSRAHLKVIHGLDVKEDDVPLDKATN